jgi:hypothetical protein
MHWNFDKPCHNYESLRVPTLRFLTRCNGALEGGGHPEGLHGQGGSFSWVVQVGIRELVNFGLLCVEKSSYLEC